MTELDSSEKWGRKMALTVREVWQMDKFKSFRLVAGRNGLDNEIENIGILDYEYAVEDEELQQKWAFGRKGFVISSLLFAKDHPERILNAFCGLVRDHVSALAIKTVCYQELPEEAIRYADENNLPIFLFGRDDAYFEEIVFEIKEKITGWNDAKKIEKQVDLLVRGDLGEEDRKNLLHKIVKVWKTWYLVIYEKYLTDIKESEIIRRTRRLNDIVAEEGCALFYHHGILLLLTDEKKENLRRYRNYLLGTKILGEEEAFFGIGEMHTKSSEIRQAITESIYAQRYGLLKNEKRTFFDKIGIYKILLPYYEENWMRNYSVNILEKVISFDRENDGELFDTLRILVDVCGDIQAVSEKMHVHKNTIRYRVNRAREILNMEEDPTFMEQISVAVKIYELYSDKEKYFESCDFK